MLLRLSTVFVCFLGMLQAARAAITPTGDVTPANPATWTIATNGFVGGTSAGTLTVDWGWDLYSHTVDVGSSTGSTGQVTVTGNGSTWTNGSLLTIGRYGNGLLDVSSGGMVSSVGGLVVGNYSGSTGTATVSGNGSFLTTGVGSLYVGLEGAGSFYVKGGGTASSYNTGGVGYYPGANGTVNISGTGSALLGNGQLFYIGYRGNGAMDITGGATVSGIGSSIGEQFGSRGTVTVDGIGSTWASNQPLTIGTRGTANLVVSRGAALSNTLGTIAGSLDSNGVATITGTDSTWTNTDKLYVGYGGSFAMLNVLDGAVVNNTEGYIGRDSSTIGVANVVGAGSRWNSSGILNIGFNGKGTLSVSHGGAVAAANVAITPQSLLAIDVVGGSQLSIGGGSGWIANSGTVRISAAANAAPGVYSPILAGLFFGSGTYQALGGTWNTSTHQFTVAPAQSGASGDTIVMAMSAAPRVAFSDTGSGWSVGASFGAVAGSSSLSFAATAIAGASRDSLESLLGTGPLILGGWQFQATSGYSQGNPVYLTFDVGPGYSPSDLRVWHESGGVWNSYSPTDLTYDGRYASFTVNGFSGYAVTTAPVPEPSTLALAAVAVVGLGLYRAHQARRRSISHSPGR